MPLLSKVFVLGLLSCLLLWPGPGIAADYQQAAGLIDLRTTASDGAHDAGHLARLARERGFQVLLITDHDRMAMEYGLLGFRDLIRYRVEKPSVNMAGAQQYLDGFERASKEHPDILIIPGIESAPFYYWSGDPLIAGLTANNWERHLLVFGLERATDIETLPVLHNQTNSGLDATKLPLFVLYVAAGLLGLFICRRSGRVRLAGVVIAWTGLALAAGNPPLRGPDYDQYHGDQGAAPYQHFIDAVTARGGLVFWNHPETHSGAGSLGPVRRATMPYPDMLEQTTGYTGFAALYGDRITIIEPGQQWDQVLLAYCRGERSEPAWAISAADLHRDGENSALGDYPTVFLVRELSRTEVLEAMAQGRMYAVRGPYRQRMILEEFSVAEAAGQQKAISGETLTRRSDSTLVRVAVRTEGAEKCPLLVRLIRNGEVVKDLREFPPFALEFEDSTPHPVNGKSYYRVMVEGKIGAIISNPIFVRAPCAISAGAIQ